MTLETKFTLEDKMKKSIFAIALLATAAACTAPAEDAQDTATVEAALEPGLLADLGGEPTGPVYSETKGDRLAISGFDTVSYFEGDGVPVEGSEDYTVRYEGYDYRFASEENAEKFIADPAAYAPQYGGYCAWALGSPDALAPGNANVYEVVDGKLYLNFSEDVQSNWREDIPGFIEQANINYPAHSADEHFTD
ncbi:MAG: YHS domain-containing (seleno)protein [Erythrobacter sp.]